MKHDLMDAQRCADAALEVLGKPNGKLNAIRLLISAVRHLVSYLSDREGL